jgi:hypothetical protein
MMAPFSMERKRTQYYQDEIKVWHFLCEFPYTYDLQILFSAVVIISAQFFFSSCESLEEFNLENFVKFLGMLL